MAAAAPFIPAIIAAVAAAGSITTQVIGMEQSAKAAKTQRANLRRQEELAKRDQLEDLRRARAASRAEAAGSGVDVFFGSPLDRLGELEAQAFENFSRLELDFANRIDASRAESDAIRLQSVGNILGTATTPLAHLPSFDTSIDSQPTETGG